MWNSAQCYVTAWIGGKFGREWIHLYVWLGPFAIHLKLSQILKAIPPYKIKSLKFGKNYTPIKIILKKNKPND